jgi:hypothetical protein
MAIEPATFNMSTAIRACDAGLREDTGENVTNETADDVRSSNLGKLGQPHPLHLQIENVVPTSITSSIPSQKRKSADS